MNSKTFVLFIFLLSSNLFGQSFYIRLFSGYGIGVSPQSMYESNLYCRTVKAYSFGKGLYFGSGFGYLLGQNFGIDLELQYLDGLSTSINNVYSSSSSSSIFKYDYYGNAFMVIPSLMLKTDIGFVKSYFKIGPIFSFASITRNMNYNYTATIENYNTNSSYVENDIITSEFLSSGAMAFGLSAALGASKEIWKNTEIFIEINSKNISYAPTKGEMKKYSVNGVDRLQYLDMNVKEERYFDSFSNVAEPNEEDKPFLKPRTSYPFSSITFSFGISYDF